jgi:hypothetical protein
MTNLRDALDHELARHVGGRSAQRTAAVSDEEADWLFEEGYEEAYGREPVTLTRALVALRRRRRDAPTRTPTAPARRRPGLREHHDHAMAALLRHALETDAQDAFQIRRFRATVLQGRLMTPGRVGAWIRTRASEQQPLDTAGRSENTASLLAYVDPSGAVGRLATRHDVLHDLRGISERIASFTGWHPARATTYVLTGEAPVLASIQAEMRWRAPFATRSRIVLTIDPTCTPQEVAALYRQYRGARFGRLRRLSSKHAQLAMFAATHDHLSPADRMAEWNRTAHRGARYRRLATLNRDCQLAHERLTEFDPKHRRRWGPLS